MVSNVNVKLVILGFQASSILVGTPSSGQLYTAMPGQSGTVMTLNNVSGLVASCRWHLDLWLNSMGCKVPCGYLQPLSC